MAGFMDKMLQPGAPMRNSSLPRPTSKGVIGPPKIKMPDKAGQSMPQMSSAMPKASLGRKSGLLPKAPNLNVGGTASLLHSKSPLGKIGS